MGRSTSLLAVKPADETYRKHLAVVEACAVADVAIPPRTVAYFNGHERYETLDEDPDPAGVVVHLGSVGYLNDTSHQCIEDWRGDYEGGAQVDITKLPEGTRYIRVVLS